MISFMPFLNTLKANPALGEREIHTHSAWWVFVYGSLCKLIGRVKQPLFRGWQALLSGSLPGKIAHENFSSEAVPVSPSEETKLPCCEPLELSRQERTTESPLVRCGLRLQPSWWTASPSAVILMVKEELKRKTDLIKAQLFGWNECLLLLLNSLQNILNFFLWYVLPCIPDDFF